MDPIVAALVAGATFILKGTASEAVKDAYQALKNSVAGKLSSLANLEEDPSDEDFNRAASKEIQKKGLADDPSVLKNAEILSQVIAKQPQDKLTLAAIDIDRLRAAHDVIIRRLNAKGEIAVRDITSEQGTIDIQDVSAGTLEKND